MSIDKHGIAIREGDRYRTEDGAESRVCGSMMASAHKYLDSWARCEILDRANRESSRTEHEARRGIDKHKEQVAEIRAIASGHVENARQKIMLLADQCGALRTERDALLIENAQLRREVERLQRRMAKAPNGGK